MREGLTRVSLLPVRSGYIEAQVGLLSGRGPYARLEGGRRLTSSVNVFGFGQWTRVESMAGAGISINF